MTTVLEQPRTTQRSASPWLPILSAVWPASLLLFAAAMKWKQLPVIERMGNDLLHNPYIAAAQILLESALALWLLSSSIPNVRPHLRYGIINNHYAAISNPLSRVVALITFSLFAIITAYRGIAGEDSCGCFGQFKVNPWITLTLDLSVIALLLASLRSKSRTPTTDFTDSTDNSMLSSEQSAQSVVQRSSPAFSAPSCGTPSRSDRGPNPLPEPSSGQSSSAPICENLRIITPLLRPSFLLALLVPSRGQSSSVYSVVIKSSALAAMLAIAALTLWRMPSTSPAGGNTGIIRAGTLLVLDTEKWPGKPLPILPYLEPRDAPALALDQLTADRWRLVIYNSDCDHCRQSLPRLLQSIAANPDQSQRYCFVQVPSDASDDEDLVPTDRYGLRARLTPREEWFASTPIILELTDGIVQRAAEGKAAEKKLEDIYPQMSADLRR